MKQSILYLFLLFGFVILFLNCKDRSVTPPEATIPEISGVELSAEPIIVNDTVLITVNLSEELGTEYALKWQLSGYQTEIDTITSETIFSWKAPKVHEMYEHSVQIVSATGEPVSDAHPFATEISSIPVVPEEGNKLVFSMPEEDGSKQIFSMNIDGTELTQLTFFAPNGSYEPSWSPDGKQIVFTSSFMSTTAGPTIYLMNADGTNIRPMKPSPDSNIAHAGSNPKWSPDGTKIAFDAGLNREIFIYDFETDSVFRLTNHSGADRQPFWSPDSKQIVFTSQRDYYDADSLRYRTDLYVIDADGQNPTRLTEYGYILDPIWNQSGSSIAFRDISFPYSLGLLHIETAEIETINDPFPDEELTFPHPVSWSMDDNKLFIRLTEHPNDTFYILDITTGKAEKMPFEPQEDVDVDWYQFEEN